MTDYFHKPVKYVTPSRRIIVTYGNKPWENDEMLISEEDYDNVESFLKAPHHFSIIPKVENKPTFFNAGLTESSTVEADPVEIPAEIKVIARNEQ